MTMMLQVWMYTCMCTQGYVRLGLVLGRHPKINLFNLFYTTVLLVVKWRQNLFGFYTLETYHEWRSIWRFQPQHNMPLQLKKRHLPLNACFTKPPRTINLQEERDLTVVWESLTGPHLPIGLFFCKRTQFSEFISKIQENRMAVWHILTSTVIRSFFLRTEICPLLSSPNVSF